jgi:hypothetical protein
MLEIGKAMVLCYQYNVPARSTLRPANRRHIAAAPHLRATPIRAQAGINPHKVFLF